MSDGTSSHELEQPRSQRLLEAAWPDLFANLQEAYAELTEAQFGLEAHAEELEEARDLFQQVVESMSEALFLMDSAGRVVRANSAAAALVGRPKESILRAPLEHAAGTDALPATAWKLLALSPSGAVTDIDFEIIRPDGSAVPVSASCGLVRDKRGKITGVLAVLRDITERKRSEEALARQAEELARSNRELEQFAYVASHDLQEPLRMVSSFTSLLAQRFQGKLGPEADEFIAYVVDGATRMQELIKDLLAYSRIGRADQELTPADCNTVVAASCKNLKAAIDEANATITVAELPTVHANRTELLQLFQNLIGNAVKFRADRPVRVEIGARREGGSWLFWVRDNGIGMEPQYRERIFLIFQRLHGRRRYPGTGIGLALSKKIVERHGGRIWVESAVGRGSTFYFTLRDEGSRSDA